MGRCEKHCPKILCWSETNFAAAVFSNKISSKLIQFCETLSCCSFPPKSASAKSWCQALTMLTLPEVLHIPPERTRSLLPIWLWKDFI